MIKINPLHDADNTRQQRNMTNSQKRMNMNVKEGVVVNSLIRDNNSILSDMYNSMIISSHSAMPEKLYEQDISSKNGIKPIVGLSLGIMSGVALFSAFVKRNAKIATNLAKEKWLPTVTRNVNLSEETTQAIYQMIQNPSRTTIIATTGLLSLTAMAFMIKTFVDGYKEICVKKKEADIQKNLQENLIATETQAFSGKMDIIRSMLSNYAKEFENYLQPQKDEVLNFGKSSKISFTGVKDKSSNDSKKGVIKYLIGGMATMAGIIGLGFYALKNAAKSREYLQHYMSDTKNVIENIVKNTDLENQKADMSILENLFKIVNATPEYIKQVLKDVNWNNAEKSKYIESVIQKINTSTTKVNPNIGGDGTAKPAFNSFVSDYRAFFYNWLLDPSNPQFKQLFVGVTGVTAVGYGGKLIGDAIKEVQVKKINAQTELELQQRLVSTELRNFKSKKDAAIKPLVDEFYNQVENGKSKEELKVMAENILFEIKNGAPFVYS